MGTAISGPNVLLVEEMHAVQDTYSPGPRSGTRRGMKAKTATGDKRRLTGKGPPTGPGDGEKLS